MIRSIVLLITLLPISFAGAETSSTSFDDIHRAVTTNLRLKNTKSKKKKSNFFVDYARYEERVYGRSNKSEIGDQMELDFSARWNLSPNTFMRFGFEVDPNETALTSARDSKAQKFDTFFNHKVGNFTVQAELELDTNTKNEKADASVDFGGISFGFDNDSEGSFISYSAFDGVFDFTFYPFNFDSEVGDEFNSWDVARLYFIDGAPSSIRNSPFENEVIKFKTIPGGSINFKPTKGLVFTVGGGLTSYLYPSNPNFDIRTSTTSNSWERRQDVGFKTAAGYANKNFRIRGEYAFHDKDKETGSLLKAAGSLTSAVLINNLILSGEVGMSQAGRRPYRIRKGGGWFEDETRFNPVYASRAGTAHKWIGQTDFAYMAKVGYRFSKNFVPYVFYKVQGDDYIFRDNESAHKLRNFDDELSHGGLQRIGLGAQFQAKNFTFRPDIEFRQAKNAVFSKSAGIQDDELNSGYRKNDFLLSLVVSYDLKDSSLWGWWKNQGEGNYGEKDQ